MKALKITLEHGKIWTVATSDGRNTQASTLGGALDALLPEEKRGWPSNFIGIQEIFDHVRDSAGATQIARGQASA